jgi:hypothetical protein
MGSGAAAGALLTGGGASGVGASWAQSRAAGHRSTNDKTASRRRDTEGIQLLDAQLVKFGDMNVQWAAYDGSQGSATTEVSLASEETEREGAPKRGG